MNNQTEIPYPVLKYNGGKFRLREWIVSHFPEHYTYVETCLGAGSILLNKKRSKWEVANDIDGMVHNFFEVLRDQPYQLISRIRNTPYSEDIFEELLHSLTMKLNAPSYHDPVKTAWEYYCICWMSMRANDIRLSSMKKYKPTFRSKGNMGAIGGHNPARLLARTEHLWTIRHRLQGVCFTRRDAAEVIQEYDSLDTLHYIDLPYLGNSRKTKSLYTHEFLMEEGHERILRVAASVKGKVIASHYPHPLYDSILCEEHGWTRVETKTVANCMVADVDIEKKRRIEALYISPRAQTQPKLF